MRLRLQRAVAAQIVRRRRGPPSGGRFVGGEPVDVSAPLRYNGCIPKRIIVAVLVIGAAALTRQFNRRILEIDRRPTRIALLILVNAMAIVVISVLVTFMVFW